MGCHALEYITIPESVSSIGENAFQGCDALTSITIPNSVNNIGNSAFSDCPLLIDVYYSGTEAQWSDIRIGEGNEILLNSTIHFNTHSIDKVTSSEADVLPETGDNNSALFDAYLQNHSDFKYGTWIDINGDGENELLVSIKDNTDWVVSALCALSSDGQRIYSWSLFSRLCPITYDRRQNAIVADNGGTGVFERAVIQLDGDALLVRHIGRQSPAYQNESYYYDYTDRIPGGDDVSVWYRGSLGQPDDDYLRENAITGEEYDHLYLYYQDLEKILLSPIDSMSIWVPDPMFAVEDSSQIVSVPSQTSYMWSAWSEWSTNAVQYSTTREVETRQAKRVIGYNMVHYGTQKAAEPYYRMFRDYSITGNFDKYGARYSYGEKHLTKYVTAAQMNSATSYPPNGDFVVLVYNGEDYEGFQMGNTTAYNFGDDNKVWFVESEVNSIVTEYRHRDLVQAQ